jgi:hypothetical protein
MSSFNSISNFKSAFAGGTRANRFRAGMATVPTGVDTPSGGWDSEFQFKVTAAEIPAATMGTIPVNYRGRLIMYAGDRQYSPWSITVYDDSSESGLWSMFNSWIDKMDGHVTHMMSISGGDDFTYSPFQCQMDFYQQDVNGSDIRHITLYNAWPLSVSAIDLDMGKVDPVSFSVQLVFDYIDIENITT